MLLSHLHTYTSHLTSTPNISYRQCSCPNCTGFREMLKAWDRIWSEAEKANETCSAADCRCNDPESKWRKASRGASHCHPRTLPSPPHPHPSPSPKPKPPP